jgi:hypothetical protein
MPDWSWRIAGTLVLEKISGLYLKGLSQLAELGGVRFSSVGLEVDNCPLAQASGLG